MNIFKLFKKQPEVPPQSTAEIPHNEALQELVDDLLSEQELDVEAKEADRMVTVATEIMLINLQNGFGKKPCITTEICKIKSEDASTFTAIVSGKELVVRKSETNQISFVEVRSIIESKTYWHINVSVYAEIDRSSSKQQFVEYWVDEIKKRTMQELKLQNSLIKALYNDITEITA